MQANSASNQKFEKTASIKSKSSEFEADEKGIKEKTKAYNAVIQYEQNLGQKGNRQIHLLIGVNPEKFVAALVDYLKNPTTYDGLESIAEIHPSIKSADIYPRMR